MQMQLWSTEEMCQKGCGTVGLSCLKLWMMLKNYLWLKKKVMIISKHAQTTDVTDLHAFSPPPPISSFDSSPS